MNWLWFVSLDSPLDFWRARQSKATALDCSATSLSSVIGAVLGGFLFGLLGIVSVNIVGNLISAFVGSVVLLLLIGFIKREGG